MDAHQLRVGIAGYGIVGKRRRTFIDLHPCLKTVAVCDRVFEVSGKLDDQVNFYPNYKELLKNENIDVLFVCITNDVASEVTMAALQKNIHVFCEKPPGRNIRDISDVIVVEKNNPHLKLMYGFNHRYHYSVRDALKIIQTQELGRIINMRGIYGKSHIVSKESTWRAQRSIAGGGILLDQGIHMLDMMRLFAGDFTQIYSLVSNTYWNFDVEDNAYALMKTESGIVAMLHSSATQWRHRFQLEISLERGSILLTGILSGSKSYGEEKITVAYRGEHDQGTPKEQITHYNEDNSWRDEISEFAKAILESRPITNGSSLEALKTMSLVYKIYCADSAWQEKYKINDQSPAEVLLYE